MSLLKLLAVGKSLIGIKRPPQAFLMRDDQLIPKFGDNPRPWAASALPSKPAELAPIKTEELPDATRIPGTDFYPRAEFKPAKAAQSELTVMRNDLSDADLEVVRTTKGKGAVPAAVKAGAATHPAKTEAKVLNAH